VIEVAPIREAAANANGFDVQGERMNAIAHRGSGAREANTATSRIETYIVKKEKSEARSDGDAKTRRKERKVKSTTKACEPSTSEESSEEEEDIKSRRTSNHKKSSEESRKTTGQ